MTAVRPPFSDPPEIRLPDFLVIGAMKCGTTTLYHDLLSLPDVFVPDKESNALLTADPAATCARLFARAKQGQKAGEVCPDYTKPETGERAVEAARALFANQKPPRLIYLVREPIARLLSHHYFVSTQHGEANPGSMTRDIEASLRDFPELIETSRYASRLRPWREAFGMNSIKVVRMEDFVADRVRVLSELADFLGVREPVPGAIRPERIFNSSVSRPVATPAWRRVLRQPLYRRCLRPWLPLGLRDRLRAVLLPQPPARPEPPTPETRLALAESLRPEVESLGMWMGADSPLWDLTSESCRPSPPE